MGSLFKKVGILMLDTRFPRLTGDIGNPNGLGFPVLYHTVEGASPDAVVREQDRNLLKPFIAGGNRLVERGAQIVSTSCGFLAAFQDHLQENLPVPVVTSSLLLLRELEEYHGQGRVGVLTISASSMTREFRDATGVGDQVPIGSTEGGEEFTRAILENETSFDEETCRTDNIDAARNLVSQNPDIRALLLECTNMAPYSDDIHKATGLPVHTLNSLLLGMSKPEN